MQGIADAIASFWAQLIRLLEQVVVPDWSGLVALIPLGLLPLVLLYLVATGGLWTLFALIRPRAKLDIVEGPRPLELDEGGRPDIPLGEPFSLSEGLVYPSGAVRSRSGVPLTVRCPVCGVERPAELSTCGNCGLVLRFKVGVRSARPNAGPPPGGAAVA